MTTLPPGAHVSEPVCPEATAKWQRGIWCLASVGQNEVGVYIYVFTILHDYIVIIYTSPPRTYILKSQYMRMYNIILIYIYIRYTYDDGRILKEQRIYIYQHYVRTR